MAMTVRQFVESLSSSNILSTGELSSIRTGLTAEQEATEAEEFVRKLVQQGKLTKFQAINLYQGRAKGLVFGEYVVLDKLGAGGMGQVFKAQHRRMKRIVALKVLPPHAVSSSKSIQRFYQEVEVAAKVHHPNIVTAYDAGEARGLHFLVMEFVDGQDLSSYLNKSGPLGVEQAVNVVLQAARGLAYAHGLGIVHRDIKPANLLLDEKGVVKILDMGLARIDNPLADASGPQDELTASGEVMGTVDYMSPEQAQDTRTADHRSDIYALGCTLYRLLTGKVPYAADTTIKKILAHRDQPIPTLRAARPEVPDLLDRVYQKMMAKNVADRTATMGQVAASLEQLMSGADDEKSSIAVLKEDLAHDEPNFNFLQAGASNVLPSISSIGQAGPSTSSQVGSNAGGSKSSGVLPSAAATLPTGSGSGSTPRALPPTVTGAAAQASNVPHGAVFPSLPAAGGAPKIARAKRLQPGDTDSGGKTKGDAARGAAEQAKAAGEGSSRALVLVCVGGVAALVLIGLATFLLTREPSDEAEADGAAKPTAAASGAAASGAAPKAAPNTAALTPAASVPTASPTAAPSPTAVAELPPATASTMNFFNTKPPEFSVDVPTPTPSTAGPPRSAPPRSGASPPVADAPPPAKPLEAEVDLLSLIKPDDRPYHSRWARQGSDIVCEMSTGPFPRVVVPYNPPAEYDIEARATTSKGSSNFGLGVMAAGRRVFVCFNNHMAAVDGVDGLPWSDGTNPTYYFGPLFRDGEEVDVRLAVRSQRIVLTLNGRPVVDYVFDSPAKLPAELTGEWATPLGEMFVYGASGTRLTALTAAPPAMKLPPRPTPVNVAALFDKARDGVEGEFTASRNEILVNGLPGKMSRLAFDVPRTLFYTVRVVVERRSGSDAFCVGLPIRNGRPAAMVDWGPEKLLGIQSLSGGGIDSNASGRKAGLLLTPDVQHVLKADVAKDPKGWRVRLAVDGRTWVDYAGNEFHNATETQTPDPRAVALASYASGWRIVRCDVIPEGTRLPAPATAEINATATALANLWASADAKNAPLDGKLLAVDTLRRKAAEELGNPTLRYVCLDQALRIAAQAGDLPGAYEAAEDLISAFQVDEGATRARILDVFKTARPQTPAKQKFAADVLHYATRAAHDEQFEFAAQLADGLERYLGTSEADTRREVRARETEYAFAASLKRQAYQKAAKAEGPDSALATSVAAAARAEGWYFGIALGDWDGAAAKLARGDDAAAAAAAQLEAGAPKTGEALLALADKWWEASEAQKAQEMKWALAEHAAAWYQRATPLLPPKSRTVVERRKTQIAQLRKASGGAFGPRRPLDAVKIGDRWYKFYSAQLTAPQAELACRKLGGQLLQIDSASENDLLSRYLLQAAGGPERASCWLGYSDAAEEGIFRLQDGTLLASPLYTNWGPGEPDNGNGTEDAASLDASFSNSQVRGVWSDQNPDFQRPFICEWDR